MLQLALLAGLLRVLVRGNKDTCSGLLALPRHEEGSRPSQQCWEGLPRPYEDCCVPDPQSKACWGSDQMTAECCTCSIVLSEIRIGLQIVSHPTAQGWSVGLVSDRNQQPQVRRSHRDLTGLLRLWTSEALFVLRGRGVMSTGFRKLCAEFMSREEALAKSCPVTAMLLRRLAPMLDLGFSSSVAYGIGRSGQASDLDRTAVSAMTEGQVFQLASWIKQQDAEHRGNSLCFPKRRIDSGLTYEACCGPEPPGSCWDAILRADVCCRSSGHQCAQLRLVTWTPGDLAEEHVRHDGGSVGRGSPEAGAQDEPDLRCATEDMYREYFEDTRRHVVELLEHGWEHLRTALPQTSDVKLIRVQLAHVEEACPEVAALARLGMVQQVCEDFLRRPLAPGALGVQQEVREMLESGLEYIQRETAQGRFTGLPQTALELLLQGACGKVLGAAAPDERASGVGQADYSWPGAALAGRPLAEHGVPCAGGEALHLGNRHRGPTRTDGAARCFVPGARLEDLSCGLVHLSSPMPADGRLVELNLLVDALPGAFVEVTVLRLEHDASGPVYIRKASWAGTSTTVGSGLTYPLPVHTSELLVWRGDYLCISFRNVNLHYHTDCSDCLAAEIRPQGLNRLGVVELVKHHRRAYVWNAKLIPMRCAPTAWRTPEHPLPSLRLGPPPASSRVSCSPTGLDGDRTCMYSDLCYDPKAGELSFFGDTQSALPIIGLSAWNDGRALWQPRRAPQLAEEVEWVAEPTYLVVRHAPQNWGHYVVETVLAIYALTLATENAARPHGLRVLMFLDDCSLVLRGDAVEYCLRYDPFPLHCVQEIPDLCARFTKQLWPLLSDWAPLELPLGLAADARQRGGGARPLCFRSIRAGIAPWRRRFQGPVGEAALWAADPLFAPVLRLFQGHAIARLGAPADTIARGLASAVKDGRQSVQNREELLGWLSAAASARAVPYAQVDFGLPLAAQVALMLSTRLLVASAGSSQFVGIFLPAGAALLVLPACYAVAASGIASCQAEELLATCGLRWTSYPVQWKDMVYTIGRGFSFIVQRETLEPILESLLQPG